jgi:hypothetical protein
VIDRTAYREMLGTLTDDELLRIGVGIWRDCCRITLPAGMVWHEWDDITAELTRRGTELMPRLQQMYRDENRQPTETVRQFLDQANARDAARDTARKS